MKMDEFELWDFNEEQEDLKEKSEYREQKDRKSPRKKKHNEEDDVDWKQELKSWLFTLGVTLAIVFVVKNYIIINASVPTGSMENTIMPGDNLLGFRLAYLVEEPERGDVIFFYFPDDESQKYVKRIIGLPGEKVIISGGNIYVDDATTPLEEDYLKEEWKTGTGPFEFEVPEDCYLVLGDNRNGSQDARYWANPYVAKEKDYWKGDIYVFSIQSLGSD